MLSYKILSTDAELQEYAAHGREAYNIDIPFQYFRRGITLGFFRDGRMVGGAAIITEGPFRGLNVIPEADRLKSGVESLPLEDMLEVNAVWLSKEVSKVTDVIKFWFSIIREAELTKKKWAVVPYNEAIRGLDRLYRPIGMSVIYRGAAAGASHKSVVVGICTVVAFRKALVIGAVNRLVSSTLLKKPARGFRGQKPIQSEAKAR